MKRKTKQLAPNGKVLVRNLVQGKDGTIMAGYRIGSARWDFTGRDSKTARALADADVFSHLTGRLYDERVSTRPHPVQQWAQRLDRRTPHPTPDVHVCDMSMDKGDLLRGRCGCETWNGHLVRMQNVIADSGMDDKVVFRYFSLMPKLSARVDLRAEIAKYLAGETVSKAVLAVIEDEKRVNDVVRGWPGSRRMNEAEQGWLRVRSISPGVHPTGISAVGRSGWDEDELPALASGTRWAETPFGRTVTVMSYENGREVETAVRVLSLARCTDLGYPGNGLPPWQVMAESARDASGRPFSVEWSIKGRLVAGHEIAETVERELRIALFTRRDYRKHNELPPSVVENAITVATNSRDQVTTGQAMEAARFLGQVNVIITGQADPAAGLSAADVVEERCASFTRMYSAGGLRMDFAGADCQSFMLTSTIPGEPGDTMAFQRRLRLPWLAYGMPNVSSAVGDQLGPYLGRTRGAASRPVMHDPHFATEGLKTGREQNMHLIIGTLGAGKSVLIGSIAYNLVRRGILTVVSDPSGPLAKLCQMPEIAAVSQEVNLLNGKRGILSPASLIVDPRKSDFEVDGGWADALEQTRAERRDLTVDMAMRCLPDDLVADDRARARTRLVLRRAATRHTDMASWESTTTLWDLVDHLRALDATDATDVADALTEASTAPLLRLLFPTRDGLVVPSGYDKTLTVITTPGITRAVDNTPRSEWNPMELGADAVLRLVALYTNRLVYNKPREQRAAAFFDEAETVTDFGPGRAMFSRLGRDHSKWNLAVYLGVKSVNDQMLSGELKNFLASVFVGKMADADPALAALALLGLDDPRYVDVLLNLSSVVPGEWVHLDVAGNVGAFQNDVVYHEALMKTLLTNPNPEGSTHWDLEEEML